MQNSSPPGAAGGIGVHVRGDPETRAPGLGQGDDRSLATLLAYNEEDVVNLPLLESHVVGQHRPHPRRVAHGGPASTVVDCTVDGGGHARLIADRIRVPFASSVIVGHSCLASAPKWM